MKTIMIVLIAAIAISMLFLGCTQPTNTNPPSTPGTTTVNGDVVANEATTNTIPVNGADIGQIVDTN